MGRRQLQVLRQREIARKRIPRLFELAQQKFLEGRKDLANRYVQIARRIAMKVNVRIPPALRRRFCRHCYHYFQPGVNVRVRTREGHVVYFCRDCRKHSRFPYVKERKARRSG